VTATPDVSVIVPTRNRRVLLATALRCARAQRSVELEVVVVDDASTDGTADAVRSLGDRGVRVVSLARGSGVSAARNTGISEARAPWVAFLDDDDLWSPDKLWRQLEAAEREDAEWVYAGDVNVDDRLTVLTATPPPSPDAVLRSLGRYNPVPTGASNVVVRASALERVGGFDTHLRRTEDWDLWIRLARRRPPAAVAAPLVAYRFHRGNLIADVDAIVREPEVLAARYGIDVDRAAVLRRGAWAALRAGRRGRAAALYARAIAAGDVRSLARLGVAMLHPAVGSERVFDLLPAARGDERWRADAQSWLDDVRRAEAPVP
jgi:glycosyltransferase involved in cell wall biosynthesis